MFAETEVSVQEDLLMKWQMLPEGSSFSVEFPKSSAVDGQHLVGTWEITKTREAILVEFDKERPCLRIPYLPRDAKIVAVARSESSSYAYFLKSCDVLDILQWIEDGKIIPTSDPSQLLGTAK